jgi:hypothetical protein
MSSSKISIERGCVFGAEHDPSYGNAWISDEVEWKKCLAFNLGPAVTADADDVHYFLATAELWRFRENPQLMSEVCFFDANSYPFFGQETAIEFSYLWRVPLAKLKGHRLKIQGRLSDADIKRCVESARGARLLNQKERRLLGLVN